MLKLLFKLLVLPPELFKAHAKAYSDFASWAWAQHLRSLQRRWAFYVLSAVSLFLALLFSGLALLLWCALPAVEGRHVWVLWALPGAFAVMGGWCGWAGRRTPQQQLWGTLKEQIQLDRLMFQEAQKN